MWSAEKINDLKMLFNESFAQHKANDISLMSKEAFENLVEAYDVSYEVDNSFDDELKQQAINEAYHIYENDRDESLRNLIVCFKKIKDMLSDVRQSGKVIYPVYIVVIVMLLARMRGCHSASEIADFYNQQNIVLQLLIPGMPSPEHKISANTINNIRALISEDEIEHFFMEFFGLMSLALDSLVTFNDEKYKENREGTMETYGFDGQEMRASFKKGSSSRKSKGAIAVTLMNCTARCALAFVNTGAKNQEREAFLQMLQDIDIAGKVIMCDALNSAPEVTSAIADKNAYFLMPIKKCQGNSELLNHIEAIFNRQNAASNTLNTKFSFKDHSRLETSSIEILPAAPYIDPRIKNPHAGITTIVRYTKETTSLRTQKVTSQTRYYISNLPYEAEQTLKQVKASIVDYWMIETHHNVIDTSALAQDSFQGCNPRTLSVEVALNKALYNMFTQLRNELSASKKKPVPYTYVMRRMREISLTSTFKYLVNNYLLVKYKPSMDV